VNPTVGHSNILMYDWKRNVNHSLIKTPLKKIQFIWFRTLKVYFQSIKNKIKIFSPWVGPVTLNVLASPCTLIAHTMQLKYSKQ
jgi:hypothetical protein